MDSIKNNNLDNTYSDKKKINRRKFIKRSTIAAAGTLAGVYGLQQYNSAAKLPEWTATEYPGIVLKNFELFDGVSNELRQGLKVLIEGNKIIGVIKNNEPSQHKNFKEIDLGGKTLMPGLIDNHVHITVPFMYSINLAAIQQMNTQILLNFRNCVMNGVTTVRDVGGFPGKINKFKELSHKNEIPGPRVISSLSPIAARNGEELGAPEKAPYFTNPIIKWILGGNYAERPTSTKEIEQAAEEIIGLGANWLKTLHQEHTVAANGLPIPNFSDKDFSKILEIAKKNGIKSALHAPLLSGLTAGINLGFDTFEHMVTDALIPEKFIEKLIKNDMAVMPTIMIYGDVFKTDELSELISERGNEYFTPEALRQIFKRLNRPVDKNKPAAWDSTYMKKQFPVVTENLKRLYKMGAIIGAGSDIGGTMSGFFGRFTDELKHYAQAGIQNFDILQMATSTNAKIIDMQDKIGAVQKGFLADLITIEGNPLEDINALTKVKMVMKAGTLIKTDGLNL
jgi:imidazolonepropionase-like amidohydrolase